RVFMVLVPDFSLQLGHQRVHCSVGGFQAADLHSQFAMDKPLVLPLLFGHVGRRHRLDYFADYFGACGNDHISSVDDHGTVDDDIKASAWTAMSRADGLVDAAFKCRVDGQHHRLAVHAVLCMIISIRILRAFWTLWRL